MRNYKVNQTMLNSMVGGLAERIAMDFADRMTVYVYPVTKEVLPVLYMLAPISNIKITEVLAQADLALDLVLNTGKMCAAWNADQTIPFYIVVDKSREPHDFHDKYLVFPWQQEKQHEFGMSKEYDDLSPESVDSIKREVVYDLIREVMEIDPHREGLLETPKRVIKAWKHWTSGYHVDIPAMMKVFKDGGENYDEMVIVKDIPIYSKCEHHLADIFGTCTIAYIPNGKIVGLSKLSRLADAFSRRLQVQERLTSQIADAINDNLSPKGVGVIIKARHMCMESRGICQQGHHTITSALRGVLKTDPAARAEFIKLAN